MSTEESPQSKTEFESSSQPNSKKLKIEKEAIPFSENQQKGECNSTSRSICHAGFIEADAAEDKGSRHTMEDAWIVVLDDSDYDNASKLRCSYFAIFDGHGGRQTADYAREHLHNNVLASGLPRNLRRVIEPILVERVICSLEEILAAPFITLI